MKKRRTCSCTFFSLPLIFTVVAASISHFLTAATKFSCCSSTKKYLNCILSLTLALCRSFTRWGSLACHLLSLFLCISISLYSKFVDMKTNLKLNTLDNTDTETFSAFRFRLYWLFSCLCFTRRGWPCNSRHNNLKLHLGCHTCWLSYFISVCLWCGRTGVRSSDYQNFSDG